MRRLRLRAPAEPHHVRRRGHRPVHARRRRARPRPPGTDHRARVVPRGPGRSQPTTAIVPSPRVRPSAAVAVVVSTAGRHGDADLHLRAGPRRRDQEGPVVVGTAGRQEGQGHDLRGARGVHLARAHGGAGDPGGRGHAPGDRRERQGRARPGAARGLLRQRVRVPGGGGHRRGAAGRRRRPGRRGGAGAGGEEDGGERRVRAVDGRPDGAAGAAVHGDGQHVHRVRQPARGVPPRGLWVGRARVRRPRGRAVRAELHRRRQERRRRRGRHRRPDRAAADGHGTVRVRGEDAAVLKR